jgi:uncharacterized phage protein gp47/JayE
MPYARPTLSQIIADADADIAAALPGADPLLRFSVLRIVLKTLSGFVNQHYGYQDYIAKNSVPMTAEGENLYGWGALKDVYLKDATAAGDRTFGGGGVTLFSNCTPGQPIPIGNLLQRGDGRAFITLNAVVIAGDGTASPQVMAQEPGADGNSPVGTILTLGSSLPGIQTDSVVTAAITGGADVETEDEFRSRMLQVYRNPPQGGAKADYERWALEVPGVTRAWCNPLGMGAGSVLVYFMMDDVHAAGGGFPVGTNGVAAAETRAAAATGDQLVVANYIFNPKRQPVTALVDAAAPAADPHAFTIHGAVGAPLQAAIDAAIDDVFIATGSPGGTTNLLDIEAAIAAVPGSAGVVVTAPAANIVAAAGSLATRGAVTWT